MEKEAEQRRRQEEKKRRREEEQQRRKENRKRGKKVKGQVRNSRHSSIPDRCLAPHSLNIQKPPEKTRYFGSPIGTVVENDGVPLFVRKCVELIESRGMTSVGLYRVSGKKEDCLALQDRYDQG